MNKDRELAKIIKLHRLWLESESATGQRLDLSGAQLEGIDFSGTDLSGAIFTGASLNGANFSACTLVHADFSDAYLSDVNFNRANLILVDFTRAVLKRANLSNTIEVAADATGLMRRGPRFHDADLSNANLRECHCYLSDFSGAQLVDVDMTGAMLDGVGLANNNLANINLSGANLNNANIQGSNLSGADLTSATLTHANLEGAILSKATIAGAKLMSANLADAKVDGIVYDNATRFKGIRVASCYGSARFRRYAQDQDYIEEFREAHPAYFTLWLWLTDCGRSLLRVGIWCAVFTLLFALIFYALGESAFAINNSDTLQWTFFTSVYYSVETFTTFGQGDITPRTALAAAFVTAELLVGYIMLGIMISILATKVARRS